MTKTNPSAPLSLLRLRCGLGMSRADFARVLGVTWELVEAWESGQTEPTREMQLLITRLGQQAESHSERTALRPVLDVALKERRLEQIHASAVTLM